MKKCEDIIRNLKIKKTIGSLSTTISGIYFDSRKVCPQSMYVAQKGTQHDGHVFIAMAIEKGAVCVVVEDMPQDINQSVTYIQVEDTSEALGYLASSFYGNPSQKIKLVGITGTNGKTTPVTLLHRLFIQLGYKVGLLSTIENKINDTIIPSTHTTPDAVTINQLLAKMCEEGCEYCFMEVSSHAIVQKRISGLLFTGGIFSNITHDHLDYHKTFKEYIQAKKMFFDNLPSTAFALSNMDDANGVVMLQNTKAPKTYYGLLNATADYKAKINELDFHGMHLIVDNEDVWVTLTGVFNAYNLLAIYATARLLGINKTDALCGISTLTSAEGRFNVFISDNGVIAIVDYAHTPEALQIVLNNILKIKKPTQKLITVVGCGGNRDKNKRPEMAKIANDLSSQLIITSDNPRDEDPEAIIADMMKGIINHEKVLTLVNREQAIKLAVRLADKRDIILIAGKGHEKYQEIKGVKHHFDDVEIVKKYLSIN